MKFFIHDICFVIHIIDHRHVEDDFENTPMMWACEEGQLSVVQFLATNFPDTVLHGVGD